jgi:hypothetical protein
MNKLAAMLLLLLQTSFAITPSSHAEDVEERTSYPYPLFYEDTDSFSDEDLSDLESKADSSKDESPSAWHGKIGTAKVTVDVENTDFLSQCKAEWEKRQKKNEPKKKKRSHFSKDEDDENEDEKEDHSPRVRFLMEWGNTKRDK